MIENPSHRPIARLNWNVRALKWFIAFGMMAVVIFAYAALSHSTADSLLHAVHGGLLLKMLFEAVPGGSMTICGIIALYMAFETFVICWRWADETAFTSTDAGLIPHKSTFIKSLDWHEIADVQRVEIKRILFGNYAVLAINLRSGRHKKILALSDEDGAIEKFANICRDRIATSSNSPNPALDRAGDSS